jgi:hypothetical protein
MRPALRHPGHGRSPGPRRPDHAATVPDMNRTAVFGILGGLAWFVAGILVGHFLW